MATGWNEAGRLGIACLSRVSIASGSVTLWHETFDMHPSASSATILDRDQRLEALSALGHAGRMAVFRLLARRAPDLVTPGELAEALDLKPSTLSVHLGILARAGLIRQTRDGRFLRYGVDHGRVGGLVGFLVNECGRGHPGLFADLGSGALAEPAFAARSETGPLGVLFVCTGNSARSIFAEAILEREGKGRFRAFSGGTKPYPELNPHAVEVLRAKGHDISRLAPKDMEVYRGPDAPKMDFVFTVCDHAANEECPPLPGRPVSAHWGLPDPVKATGGPAEKALAFQQAYGMMWRRLTAFVALPLDQLGPLSLQRRLDDIGMDRSGGVA